MKLKVTLLVNLIPPARVPVYERLGELFELVVLHGGMEPNRASWKQTEVNGVRSYRVWGWQFSFRKRYQHEVFDRWFLHIEPGYFTALLREQPDAIITDEMGVRTLIALIYGTLWRKPVWIWWGGTVHTERHVGRGRRLVRRIIAIWAKYWISYGETSTKYLLGLGIERKQILQSQNSVDERHFRLSIPPLWDIHPKPVILHVGQMIRRKGITELFRAEEKLQKEGRKFSTILVGDGPDRNSLQQLVKKLHLQHVHFHPAQPPDQMPAVYKSADVLVFPTKEDVWGLVANEAVLCGVPVLCSCHAGCAPELFDSDQIFDPGDEESFASALRRAVTSQLRRTDQSRLYSSSHVAETIANTVMLTLKGINSHEGRVPNNQLG